jgi:hypothetical protein
VPAVAWLRPCCCSPQAAATGRSRPRASTPPGTAWISCKGFSIAGAAWRLRLGLHAQCGRSSVGGRSPPARTADGPGEMGPCLCRRFRNHEGPAAPGRHRARRRFPAAAFSAIRCMAAISWPCSRTMRSCVMPSGPTGMLSLSAAGRHGRRRRLHSGMVWRRLETLGHARAGRLHRHRTPVRMDPHAAHGRAACPGRRAWPDRRPTAEVCRRDGVMTKARAEPSPRCTPDGALARGPWAFRPWETSRRCWCRRTGCARDSASARSAAMPRPRRCKAVRKTCTPLRGVPAGVADLAQPSARPMRIFCTSDVPS